MFHRRHGIAGRYRRGAVLFLAAMIGAFAMPGAAPARPAPRAAPSSGIFGESLTMATPEEAPGASSVAASWGYNLGGQLGNGTTTDTDVPGAVSGLTGVTAIAAGGNHSLALLSNGTVMAWGRNGYGQLGDGTTTESDVPVAVSGLSGVTAIAGGYEYSLALLSNGTVMAWGENGSGQLGNGTHTSSDVPVAVSGLSGVTAIAAGYWHGMALLSNGTVKTWGENDAGQLGNGTHTSSDVPVTVSGLSGVTAIAAGEGHSLALLSNGTVMAWGDDSRGELGNGTSGGTSDVPVAVSGLSGVTAIAAGGSDSFALLSGGNVMAWGLNENGELGDGSETETDVPVGASGLSGVTAIAAGADHSLALLSSGAVMAWGYNNSGQLGNGTEKSSKVPVAVSGLSAATAVAAGDWDSLALGQLAPTVTGVAPNAGSTAGGNSVTITGTGFTGVTAVKFGTANAASYSVASETSIIAVSPPGTGAVNVTVTNAAGTSASSQADKFTYGATVSEVEPNAGPTAGGTSVAITGTGFTGVTAVKFGTANAASYTVSSETSIIAVSPPGTGAVNVTVTYPGGSSATSQADKFTYGATVTTVEPSAGSTAGGTSVTITGTGFTGVTAVKFGTTNAASYTVASETSIVAVSPPGTGTVDVTVTNRGGTSATVPADRFTFDSNAPSVSEISPSSGEESGGSTVTITGTNLGEATAVKFGATNAKSFKVESASSIIAVSPAGKGKVEVLVSDNGVTSSSSSADVFRYDGRSSCTPRESEFPVITSVQPGGGPDAGGNLVTIKGRNFFITVFCEPPLESLGVDYVVTKIMFGSQEAKNETGSFKEESEGKLTALAPPGTGTVPVSVEAFGTSPASPAAQYAYAPSAPTVVTEPGSGVTQSSATMNATVNPNGGEVSECKLEYGITEAYGSSAVCSPSPGSGSGPVAVAAPISGLSANTTYHFRVSATNSGGTSKGSDETFKTLPAPPVCGPASSPGGQGTVGLCNWYNAGEILPVSTPRVFLSWGGFTSTSLSQTSALGEISCKTAGFGTVENPSGGAGVGKIFGFGFYSCVAPKCEKEAEEAVGEPGRATVTALNLPWKQSLSVGGAPESVRDDIGTPFSGTFGAPSSGEVDVKVVCEVVATGEHLKTANFEGELEPQIGIGAGPGPGLNGNPSEIAFSGAGSGALHSEAGGEATYSGSIKYGQYFPWGSLEVW